MLDGFYISVFNHYKKALGKKSLVLAMLYINLLESSIMLCLLAFFMAFANQMKMIVMSVTKFWVIFIILVIIITFKNWMRYNGRKRNILNAKLKSKKTPIHILWILPLASLGLAIILLQAQ